MEFVKTVAAAIVASVLLTFITSAMPARYTPARLGASFGTFVANHIPCSERSE